MNKAMNALIDFDKLSKEAVSDIRAVGITDWWGTFMESNGYLSAEGVMPIVDIIKDICESDKSHDAKVFELESVGCDMSLVAIELGLLAGKESRK